MSEQQLKDQYIKVGNIKTRYWALGDGSSTVILIHGFVGYIENWEDNITALAQGRKVYALDLPGFGRSDKPEARFSIPYFADFVKDFMIVQDIDKATLIGLSMGGAIVLQFALQYPHQVEKMVLVDSGGLGKEVLISSRIASLPILGELLSRPNRQGSAQVFKQIFYNQDLITDQMIEEGYEMSSLPGAQRCGLSTLRTSCNIWGVKGNALRPIRDHLEEIEVPSLVIWGAQDRILPVAHAHLAAKRLPNARLHIFDPCGHMPNMERAEEFNALVTDFLSNG
jgi:pimeloyl-ACP methyl ester carboxylesterase